MYVRVCGAHIDTHIFIHIFETQDNECVVHIKLGEEDSRESYSVKKRVCEGLEDRRCQCPANYNDTKTLTAFGFCRFLNAAKGEMMNIASVNQAGVLLDPITRRNEIATLQELKLLHTGRCREWVVWL
jgi:hypothetical protein